MHRLSYDIRNGFTIYSFYKGHRETSFFSEENADFFHTVSLSKCILKFSRPNHGKGINRNGLGQGMPLRQGMPCLYILIWNLFLGTLYLTPCKLRTCPVF